MFLSFLKSFKIREDHLQFVINTLKGRPYEEVHVAMMLLEQLPLLDEPTVDETTGEILDDEPVVKKTKKSKKAEKVIQ